MYLNVSLLSQCWPKKPCPREVDVDLRLWTCAWQRSNLQWVRNLPEQKSTQNNWEKLKNTLRRRDKLEYHKNIQKQGCTTRDKEEQIPAASTRRLKALVLRTQFLKDVNNRTSSKMLRGVGGARTPVKFSLC